MNVIFFREIYVFLCFKGEFPQEEFYESNWPGPYPSVDKLTGKMWQSARMKRKYLVIVV